MSNDPVQTDALLITFIWFTLGIVFVLLGDAIEFYLDLLGERGIDGNFGDPFPEGDVLLLGTFSEPIDNFLSKGLLLFGIGAGDYAGNN
jgi:hypothetical protein